MKKKISPLIILGLSSSFLFGCSSNKTNDINIIYTTDVHSGIDKNIGYSSLYAFKENLEKTNNYVTLVDSGDFIQGDFIGSISQGEYAVEIMNEVHYDIVTLGNHEFDYGMDILKDRINELNSEVTSCNFTYIGHKENKFSKVKPYIIKQYGSKKVGYVGVTTPSTLVDSNPDHFIEDGEFAYDFGGSSKEGFYKIVQDNIDACKKDGADYVIILSHLGSIKENSPFASLDVIANTSGATAFLDGHAHASVPWTILKNKNNEDTLLVEAGYKLNNFASLTIKEDGSLSYEFFDKYEEKSSKIDEAINKINAKADEIGNKVIANIDVDLKISDENGIRMVRNRETPIANLVADSYRTISGANIGVVNGGGVRDNLAKGNVTYKDIAAVHPFGNYLKVKKTTGATILDYLEFASQKTEAERVKDNKPVGEFGAFASVSGLKYSIDTSIPSSVIVDDHGAFIKVDGPRRVKNVQVYEDGNFVDIDPNKTYTISSHDYLLDSGGDGANMFKDDETIPSEQLLDYEVVIKYIVDILQGHLIDKYSSPEGRIVIL